MGIVVITLLGTWDEIGFVSAVAVGWAIDEMLAAVNLNDRQHGSIVIRGGELIIFRNMQ